MAAPALLRRAPPTGLRQIHKIADTHVDSRFQLKCCVVAPELPQGTACTRTNALVSSAGSVWGPLCFALCTVHKLACRVTQRRRPHRLFLSTQALAACRLPNGMRVLAVQDPEAVFAAACMNVQVRQRGAGAVLLGSCVATAASLYHLWLQGDASPHMVLWVRLESWRAVMRGPTGQTGQTHRTEATAVVATSCQALGQVCSALAPG
jgi:hypothetical protein